MPDNQSAVPAGLVEALKERLRSGGPDRDEWTEAGMEDAFFRWPVIERELRAALISSDSPVVGEDERQRMDEILERQLNDKSRRLVPSAREKEIYATAESMGPVPDNIEDFAGRLIAAARAVDAKPTPTDTADRREAIAGDLRIRILTLLETLQADDFANADIGRAYADEAREIAASLIAGPLPEGYLPYTYAIGDAAQAYLKSKGGDDARLPGSFFWTELWDAMNQAARPTGES